MDIFFHWYPRGTYEINSSTFSRISKPSFPFPSLCHAERLIYNGGFSGPLFHGNPRIVRVADGYLRTSGRTYDVYRRWLWRCSCRRKKTQTKAVVTFCRSVWIINSLWDGIEYKSHRAEANRSELNIEYCSNSLRLICSLVTYNTKQFSHPGIRKVRLFFPLRRPLSSMIY